MKHAHVLNERIAGQAAFFNTFVPEYVGMTYRPLIVQIRPWSRDIALATGVLNIDRADKRWATYVDPAEVERVKRKLTRKDNASIRFGVKKEGTGYEGQERGDFCLIGGAIRDARLTVFYRRLELVNGWAFDQVLIQRLAAELGLAWKSVSIFAVQADVYARWGSADHKLYEQLKGLYR